MGRTRNAPQVVTLPEPRSRPFDWSTVADGSWWALSRRTTANPDGDHDQEPRRALQAARMWARRNGMLAEARLPPTDNPDAQWAIRFYPR